LDTGTVEADAGADGRVDVFVCVAEGFGRGAAGGGVRFVVGAGRAGFAAGEDVDAR